MNSIESNGAISVTAQVHRFRAGMEKSGAFLKGFISVIVELCSQPDVQEH